MDIKFKLWFSIFFAEQQFDINGISEFQLSLESLFDL